MTDNLPVAVGARGVQISEINDLFRVAEAATQSGVYRVRNAQHAFVIMARGMELGFGAMQALDNVWLGPDGKANLMVEAAWALVLSSGQVQDFKDTPETDAHTFAVKRKGFDWKSYTYTLAQAKAAGLVKSGGNWEKHQARMLSARARGFLLKDVFPDLLRGFGVAEVRDEYYRADNAKDVTPQPSEPPQGTDPLFENPPERPERAASPARDGEVHLPTPSAPEATESPQSSNPADDMTSTVVTGKQDSAGAFSLTSPPDTTDPRFVYLMSADGVGVMERHQRNNGGAKAFLRDLGAAMHATDDDTARDIWLANVHNVDGMRKIDDKTVKAQIGGLDELVRQLGPSEEDCLRTG